MSSKVVASRPATVSAQPPSMCNSSSSAIRTLALAKGVFTKTLGLGFWHCWFLGRVLGAGWVVDDEGRVVDDEGRVVDDELMPRLAPKATASLKSFSTSVTVASIISWT